MTVAIPALLRVDWSSSFRVFAALVPLCILPAGSNAAPLQTPDYQDAVRLVQQKQFDRAAVLLGEILTKTPDDLKARNLLGIALSAANRKEEANDQFQKVLAMNPGFVPALKNLAVNELSLQHTEAAKAHFEQALASAPQDPTCHWGLAEIAFAARDFSRAASHYEQSGALASAQAATILRYGTSCAETKQLEKANAILSTIPVDADPAIQFQAGLVFARLEMFRAAADRFRLAQRGFKDPYQPGFNLVLMLIRSDDYAGAIASAREMLEAGYRKAELYNLLAQAYEKAGKTADAYESLRAATELEPNDDTNYLDLGLLCLEHENYDLAAKITEAGTRRNPSSPRLHLQRGVVFATSGRLEEALKEFEISSTLAPDQRFPRVAAGFVLMQLERYSEAIELLRTQSARTPDDPYVLWFLGEALNRSSSKPGTELEKEAIDALERSVSLAPRLAQPRAVLGKILLRRGEVDRSVAQLEKAVELDPSDMGATYQLAQALQKKGDVTRARQLFSIVQQAGTRERDATRQNLLRILKSDQRQN
jgi:tetratricopeptide (TPR) repeat protein